MLYQRSFWKDELPKVISFFCINHKKVKRIRSTKWLRWATVDSFPNGNELTSFFWRLFGIPANHQRGIDSKSASTILRAFFFHFPARNLE
jgi:hypothetical protein